MSDTIASARRLIRSHLADLNAEAKSLERALASMGEGSVPRRRGPGRPRKRAAAAPSRRKHRASRKRKRAPRGQRREQLLAAIKANPGARPTELARAMGVKPPQVHTLIGKARGEGLIAGRGKGYVLKT